MSLRTKDLDVVEVGLDTHFNEALGDVLLALNEQELGNRKEGAITATFKVAFQRNRDGVTYDVTSNVKAPGRIITEGGSAYMHEGRLQVIDAKQEELPLDDGKVTKLRDKSNGGDE